MPGPGRKGRRRRERIIALLLFAAIAFNPPLLRVFGAEAAVFGWPLLYVYVLGVWAAVIAVFAWLVERP